MNATRTILYSTFGAASIAAIACASGAVDMAARPGGTSAAITAEDLRHRLYVFADDSMMGREAGTPGSAKAAAYLAAEAARLGLEPAGDSGTYFQELRATSSRFSGGPPGTSSNVIAILRGSDPVLRNEYVAVGAHKDHVGFRRAGPIDHDSLKALNTELTRLGAPHWNGSAAAKRDSLRKVIRINIDSLRALRAARPDSISNGADDDGSGSVSVLEIAEALSSLRVKPKRSIIFVWHTAEEKGLLGAKYFTENPTVPREQIIAQLNLDMVGRGGAADIAGGGPDYLQLVGSRRLSKQLGDLVEQVNAASSRPFRFDYHFDADGHSERIYCRSDHYLYARYGIPVAFFTTGLHPDYHQVTDEPQYIDYPKLARVANFVRDVAVRVANLETRPVADKPAGDPAARCVQ
ncbi:MAG: M20/M25/M40 family metallo-hydrolase [Gemmatimonadaceae bacterium]